MEARSGEGVLAPSGWRRFRPELGLALGALCVGAVVFGLMRLTWPSPLPAQLERRLLQTSDMLLALATTVCTFVVAWSFTLGARREDPVSVRHRWRSFLGLWALFAVVFLTWWVGEWPGHYISDSRQSLRVSSEFRVEPWLSTFWGIWAHGLHRATGQFSTTTLFNVLVFAVVLADFFSLLLHLGLSRRVGGLFIALVVTSIPLGVLVIFVSHDILNALLRLGIALILLRAMVRRSLTGRSGVTPVTLPALVLLTATATFLRGDSLALVLYVPVVLVLSRQVRVALAVAVLVGTVGLMQVFRRGIEPRLLVEWPEIKQRYTLTLLLNPLGFMVNNHYFTPDPEGDKAAMEEVVAYSCLRDRYLLEESPCYWDALHPPVTPEKMAELKRVYFRMARDNPALLLSNRLITFAGVLGLSVRVPPPFIPHRETADVNAAYSPAGAQLLAEHGLDPAKAPQSIARVTHWLRDASWPEALGGRYLFFPWNGLPALLLALWLVSRWRTLPVSAVTAGAILGPAAMVFLAAPASHPSYVTDLWVFGYLAVPLAWFEARVLRARVAAQPPSAGGEGGAAGPVDVAPAHLRHNG
ncbi:hypothetical protein LZ198_09565 [Myxococcus sp. K15C18031901]|uniref:hypothetical protein n=1 Tax=Myxococcus dinghuensis TaxID=2906761 RepID=UPI0020A7AA8A|nr:hypothetical protein [Myxococcus dinghuensis]MCP3099115.1 hypothetical protein [Myxococcus dinghuensis]